MYGALEVFSKSSLGAYLSQHGRCLQCCNLFGFINELREVTDVT